MKNEIKQREKLSVFPSLLATLQLSVQKNKILERSIVYKKH